MPGFSDAFETNLLELLFNAAAIAGICDNAASSPNAVLWLSLHSADPGDTGTQGTNEISYPSYSRVSVSRSTGGFIVNGNEATLVGNVQFAGVTSTSTGTIAFMAWGLTSAASTGKIIAAGPVTPAVHFSEGVHPKILATSDTFVRLE